MGIAAPKIETRAPRQGVRERCQGPTRGARDFKPIARKSGDGSREPVGGASIPWAAPGILGAVAGNPRATLEASRAVAGFPLQSNRGMVPHIGRRTRQGNARNARNEDQPHA